MSNDDDGSRALPSSRLGRIARLAVVGARVGVSAVSGDKGEAAAKAAAHALGTLRGVAAKVGQMTAYVDGLVPEEHRDAYEKHMKSLLAATPRSTPEAIRGQLEKELGQPVDELFAEWSDEPLASASIGQVHRARLHDGREVAVKVQHPGVAEAVESDLKNAGLVEGAVAMLGTRKLESKRVLEEVRTRFREELDYGLEATRQTHFRAVFAGDPQIRIPEVIADRSSKAVLTMELVRGLRFDAAREASLEDRRKWIEALWRFVYKGTLIGEMFNADPHPGNDFFHEGGAVSFLDFGCVQPMTPGQAERGKATHRAALARDEDAFFKAARVMLGTKRNTRHEELSFGYLRRAFKPQFESPFLLDREYAGGLVGEFKRIAGETVRMKEGEATALPEGIFFLNRLQFGFYSVVARLDAEVDFATVERAFLG